MKIVLAPDSFKESMTAREAAAAMARGVRHVVPDAECVEVPLADGGEGTVDTLVHALGGEVRRVPAHDALGAPIVAEYGLAPDGLAIIESAAAVGLDLVPRSRRDVMAANTAGVGDLISDALDHGADRLLIGVGGTATNDGGAGMLSRLGVRFLDAAGEPVPPLPGQLARARGVDFSGLDPRLSRARITLASDVTNPLNGPRGASAVFGPQKGATPEQVPVLDAMLNGLYAAVAQACGHDVRELPGAGAGGGLGAALLSLGAERRRGIDVVCEVTRLESHIADADLVLTGEGSLDRQTLSGKTPAGVLEIARRHGVPVVALAGRLGDGADELVRHGFAAVASIVPGPTDLGEALARGPENLERQTATIMRLVTMRLS